MAFSKAARSKILSLVQHAKSLLVQEVADQLQQFYGIRPDGTVLMIDELTAGEPDIIYTARLLRQRLEYIKANLPTQGNTDVESIRQLIREQAFTILNRFASLRMAEERGIIKETIRKEYNSEGFQVFDSITGQGKTAEEYVRYKWYIYAIFDELSLDLPSIFDRFSPYALIFPAEKAMRSLLHIINNEDVKMHREEGMQPINLWKEDETIGWIYQYYNSKDEIKEMREASDSPRNSRELAVRNQFFTPRYVVQFLTDNSLGRIWYEMTGSYTSLKTICQYLITNPNEVFLKKGELKSDIPDDNKHFIEYREVKDPREIRLLDPACGSMHFGLYAFELLETIYQEAWDNHPELLVDLRNGMTRQQFIQQIPEYIIRYNIYGVDIDPRALQIAGLSLWLRAQKSFDRLNLPPDKRPQITKSNLVLAEAMPGNSSMLAELVKPLEAPMRKLVLSIWDLMKMAGETGLLLRIEEEIDRKIKAISEELIDEAKHTQLTLSGDDTQTQAAEKAALYVTKAYRDNFLDTAETEVLKILQQLAESATNGEAYQKLLFAEDTARGFAFIELCRKKYDVVVMNPPFGSASKNTIDYLRSSYPHFCDNLYIGFSIRMIELVNIKGLIGSITDRGYINKQSFEEFRKDIIFENGLISLIDLGGEVLDGANVEVSAQILSKHHRDLAIFIDLKDIRAKENELKKKIINRDGLEQIHLESFLRFPHTSFVYNLPKPLFKSFNEGQVIGDHLFSSQRGLAASDANRMFRLFWETQTDQIGTYWTYFQNGSSFCPYYHPPFLLVISENQTFKTVLSLDSGRITGADFYYKPGISYGKRTDFIYGFKMRAGNVFSVEGHGVFPLEPTNVWLSLLVINSSPYQEVINHLCGQHKTSGYVNPARMTIEKFIDRSHEVKSIVNSLELLDTGNENSPVFLYPHFFDKRNGDFKKSLAECLHQKEQISKEANKLRYQYNVLVEGAFDWKSTEIFKKEVDYPKLLFGFDNSLNNECLLTISYLVGCFFGRWDIRCLGNSKRDLGADEFQCLPRFQPGRLINSSYSEGEVSCVIEDSWLSTRNEILLEPLPSQYKNINEYELNDTIFWNGIAEQSDLIKQISTYIHRNFQKNALEDILHILGLSKFEHIFSNQNIFFNFHFEAYSRFRREAPIYWPISTSTGSYTIWLYYPKLNSQTLFTVANDYLLPKIENVSEEVKKLQSKSGLDNKGLKQLNELSDFLHELEEMKAELLRVANLPYKPNHDDGVLISAAPLYNFFRHGKWAKSTEQCWKELEKGDYDWAHLSLSIWPERVTKKCRKDLSLAIAHGLENICEVKPKDKKTKKVRTTNTATNQSLFEE
jgi:hypothetical protein